MAAIIVGWILGACVLAWQGVFVFRTGQWSWFFVTTDHQRPSLGAWERIAYGLLFLSPAVGMVLLLATELANRGVKPVFEWIIQNLGAVTLSSCCLIVGFLLLVAPKKMLRGIIRLAPDIADSRFGLLTTRAIGGGFILTGLRILSLL